MIGINSQIETGGSGDGNVGIGFAVPSNTVKSVVAQLLALGQGRARVPRRLGRRDHVRTSRKSFRLPVTKGLVIQTVSAGSGAAEAGLKAGTEQVVIAGESFRMGGDVIVAADGKADLDDRRPARRDRGAPGRATNPAEDLPRRRGEDRHRHARTATDHRLPVAAPHSRPLPGR